MSILLYIFFKIYFIIRIIMKYYFCDFICSHILCCFFRNDIYNYDDDSSDEEFNISNYSSDSSD